MADKGSGASDLAVGWFLIGCVLAALGWLIWYFQEDAIQSAVRWVRYGEMWLGSWIFWLTSIITGENGKIFWRGEEIPLGDIMDLAGSMPPSQITSDFLSLLSYAAVTPFQWIFVGIMIFMTIWLYYRGPESQFRNKYNLDGLIQKQASVFPIIQPFVRFNPAKLMPRPPGSPVPAEIPLFSEALGPEEWVAFNAIPVPDGKLDPDATARAFAKQLGPRWQGAKALAPYKQILLAAFCLKAVRKRSEADHMLGRLALCWSHDKGLQLGRDSKLISEARNILNDKKLSSKTLAACNQHAFETTALMRALWYARSEGGVMAPAQFLWLRGHDRALWYPLNNLGRSSFHMEALGAVCHYKAEKMASRPIPKPKVADAVQSISEYIDSERARPIPQIDYSGSKQRGVKKMKTA